MMIIDLRILITVCILLTATCIANCETSVSIPSNVEIRVMQNASPTMLWAVDCVARELETFYGLSVVREIGVQKPFVDSANSRVQILLVKQEASPDFIKWCKKLNLKSTVGNSGSNSYRITTLHNPLRVLIIGSDEIGAWYGACEWLNSLVVRTDKQVRMPLGEKTGAPAFDIRFARKYKPFVDTGSVKDAIPTMDWWARWRSNVTNMSFRPDSYTQKFLSEAHKRGIRVLISMDVRNTCASDDEAVAKLADRFKHFLEIGGDGMLALWDDLPNKRCDGHCEACKKRFGAKGLPSEIVHIMEAFCDVAEKHPGKEYVIWCPSHYNYGRYKELSDEDFFKVVGESAKIKSDTYMITTQCALDRVAFLDNFGIKQRIWWYNGMRSVYAILSRWKPPRSNRRLSIPNFKQFENADFARFDSGEWMDVDIGDNDKIKWPTQDKWENLRQAPERFQGYYFCGPTHPYHAAVSGLYSFSPKKFRQEEADELVFRAMFGSSSVKSARKWSDFYNELQVWLARNKNRPLSDEKRRQCVQLMENWRKARAEVEASVALGHILLPQDALKLAIEDMQKAEETVNELLK